MRFPLRPKGTEFHARLARAGQNAVDAARAASRRFSEWPDASVSATAMKEFERAGDVLTRELVSSLQGRRASPLRREDVYELATRVDDIVDQTYRASQLLDLYAVDRTSPAAIEQCEVLVLACEEVADALGGLGARSDPRATLVRIRALEDRGDTIQRDAIAALFRQPGIEPLSVIRWKDIHEALESAINACESVAHVVGNIIVKDT